MFLGCDAGVDGTDFAFICVEDIVIVAEQVAKHGCRRDCQAETFGASQEPAAKLFGVQRSGGTVEVDVGLGIWCEEESGFFAGEEQLIEG